MGIRQRRRRDGYKEARRLEKAEVAVKGEMHLRLYGFADNSLFKPFVSHFSALYVFRRSNVDSGK